MNRDLLMHPLLSKLQYIFWSLFNKRRVEEKILTIMIARLLYTINTDDKNIVGVPKNEND